MDTLCNSRSYLICMMKERNDTREVILFIIVARTVLASTGLLLKQISKYPLHNIYKTSCKIDIRQSISSLLESSVVVLIGLRFVICNNK